MIKSSTIFLSLRIFAVLISITGAVGFGWATGILYSPDTGPLAEAIGISALSISALWTLIALSLTFSIGNDRIHPAVIITVDLILGMFAAAGGIAVAISPFADASWIDCGEDRWTSICRDSAETKAVIWRFLAATFCFMNGIIHVIFLVAACKACHRLRKAKKRRSDDIELKE